MREDTENYSGSNLSGTDGTTNRTLTLANNRKTRINNFKVLINGLFLHPSEYTVKHKVDKTIITFLNVVYNEQVISVIYNVY